MVKVAKVTKDAEQTCMTKGARVLSTVRVLMSRLSRFQFSSISAWKGLRRPKAPRWGLKKGSNGKMSQGIP